MIGIKKVPKSFLSITCISRNFTKYCKSVEKLQRNNGVQIRSETLNLNSAVTKATRLYLLNHIANVRFSWDWLTCYTGELDQKFLGL